MKDVEYGPLNVTIRAHETSLLSRSHYERMLAASSFEEAVNVLRETPYRDNIDQISETKNYDTMLMDELHETFDLLFSSTSNEALIELAALRYTYHNMKVLFKEEYADQDFSNLYIPIGRYPISELRKAVRTGETSVLSDDYMVSIKELRGDINDYQNVDAIDVILDRRYLTHLRNLAETLDDSKILDLAIKQIDHYNISTVIRAVRQERTKNFLTTILSSSGSLSKDKLISSANVGIEEIERFLNGSAYAGILEGTLDSNGHLSAVKVDYALENAFMREMFDAKLQSFGPLPALAYVLAKETETKNIRLILAGKENDVDSENVKERMRLNYVS